jgi:hypothetical protein
MKPENVCSSERNQKYCKNSVLGPIFSQKPKQGSGIELKSKDHSFFYSDFQEVSIES